MTTVAPNGIAFSKAASSAGELFRTIDRKSEIDPLSDEGLVPETCKGVIEIKDITFAYPARPDTAVLQGLTLSAPARQTTALVGASGSGKSTIIGLLGMFLPVFEMSGQLTFGRTLVRSAQRTDNSRWHRHSRAQSHMAQNECSSGPARARTIFWHSLRKYRFWTFWYRESGSA
jgi:ABC-type multidrug transport system fused ATPase/permease subunit